MRMVFEVNENNLRSWLAKAHAFRAVRAELIAQKYSKGPREPPRSPECVRLQMIITQLNEGEQSGTSYEFLRKKNSRSRTIR